MNGITEEILESLNDLVFHPYRLLHGHIPKEYSRGVTFATISRLHKKGFIEKGIMEDKVCIRLTELGLKKLDGMRQRSKENAISKIRPQESRWDGLWRVVIFDIPEQNKRIRQSLRIGLRMLEFKLLQKSVWISKTNCTKELRSYIKDLGLSKFVLIFETRDLGLIQ